MFSRIVTALQARRRAKFEAEAFVLQYGPACGGAAHALGANPLAADAGRKYYRVVERIAERRRDFYEGLDTATKYEEATRWRRRSGSLIR